jgi:hypothetical protein
MSWEFCLLFMPEHIFCVAAMPFLYFPLASRARAWSRTDSLRAEHIFCTAAMPFLYFPACPWRVGNALGIIPAPLDQLPTLPAGGSKLARRFRMRTDQLPSGDLTFSPEKLRAFFGG